VTEAGTPVTTAWFLRMIQRTGVAAKLPFQVHPHMLRHSTGYKLANDGQDWPAPGSEDTELGVLMELEVGHGETSDSNIQLEYLILNHLKNEVFVLPPCTRTDSDFRLARRIFTKHRG
jgi:integrase